MEQVEPVRQQLARQVEARRTALGRTRQAVERAADISGGIVGRIEAANTLPSVETMIGLCKALDCKFVITAAGILLVHDGEAP